MNVKQSALQWITVKQTIKNKTKYKKITIRYDTRCYFNVRSKADISQLNLPHGSLIYRTEA